MSVIRVRQIIDYVNAELTNRKVMLPKVFMDVFDDLKYPKDVTKQKAYDVWGVMAEWHTYLRLKAIYGNKLVGRAFDITTDPQYNSSRAFYAACESECHDSIDQISEYFRSKYPKDDIEKISWNHEFTYKVADNLTLAGHPDVVVFLKHSAEGHTGGAHPSSEGTDECCKTQIVHIFDVKSFARITPREKKRREIRIQLALYVALAREEGYECPVVGVIAPWKRSPPVLPYNVTKWDSAPILSIAHESTGRTDETPQRQQKWMQILRYYGVGITTTTPDMLQAIKQGMIAPGLAVQVLLYGRSPSKESHEKISETITAKNRKGEFVFPRLHNYNAWCHLPYSINLAMDLPYVSELLTKFMIECNGLGFRGCVVHVAHHEDPEEGKKIMRKNLKKVFKEYKGSRNGGCILLIETPCGSGTELLTTPEEFASFVDEFPEDQLACCLDTCHVWVSGTMPKDYILRMGAVHERIALFHFNGSRKNFSCRADGHAFAGQSLNKIPDDQLLWILHYASKYSVALVVE